MKVGQWFTGKNQTTDVYYYHTNGMLAALGLEKYEKNFKRGLLTDDTPRCSAIARSRRSRSPRPAAEDPQLRRGEQETHGRVRAAARRTLRPHRKPGKA